LSFHRLNRRALLLMPPLAMGIALIAPQFSFNLANSDLPVWQLPEVMIEGQSISLASARASQVPPTWTLIYSIGLIISLAYFLFGLYRFYQVLVQAETREYQSHKIYWSSIIKNPFCFGSYIFIPTDLKDSKDLSLIIEHEIKHKTLGHVWDRLYYRALTTIVWFDPFIHAFSKELRQVHEFEVDAQVLEHNNIEDYAQTLLRSTLGADLQFPETALAPSPFFNSSLIKSRITMMYAHQSRPWRKALYGVLIPLSLAMIVFACNKNETPITVVGVESEERSLTMQDIDELPVAVGCSTESSAEERKACVFGSISKHIGDNFKYPELAEQEGLEGTIFVAFVIEKDGSVGDVKIKKSLETSSEVQEVAKEQAETQAKALIASLPKFEKAATKEGKSVRMQLIIPISLKLS